MPARNLLLFYILLPKPKRWGPPELLMTVLVKTQAFEESCSFQIDFHNSIFAKKFGKIKRPLQNYVPPLPRSKATKKITDKRPIQEPGKMTIR